MTFPVEVRAEGYTGNVQPLLHEIFHALQRLYDNGEVTIIDLRALPLAPGEEEQIEQKLGRGEVQARIDALGPSEIIETAIAGVWLVTHYNAEEEVLGRMIEICRIPALLESQDQDIEYGLDDMEALLETR
ncbi:MAG: hydrogenase expression/formation C-terminal domain-containing protein [Gammaproteobacteria bacterium]|jgi:hydrogenase-1 operon protein HyaF